MPYVPNADDLTQPTEDKELVSAAAEFRTLKAKVESNQDRIDTLEGLVDPAEGAVLQISTGAYRATAPIDMQSNKITGVATATVGSDAVPLSQVAGLIGGASTGLVAVLEEEFTATAGQTVFNLTVFTYLINSNNLAVYVNGLRQDRDVAYVETDIDTVTFLVPLQAGDAVQFFKNEGTTNVADAVLRSDLASPASGKGAEMVATDVHTFSNLAQALAAIDWAQQKAPSGINVLRYTPPSEWDAILAGTSTYDATASIQAAINAASNSTQRRVYLPAGLWNFTRLYCYYDASLNPGFKESRAGEITIEGDGIRPENGGGPAGTILNSTVTNGDALIVSPVSLDSSPWLAREFEMRDITVMAQTSGFAVRAAGVPGMLLSRAEIVQSNAAGSGLYASTSYFGTLENVRIRNSAGGAKTGSALVFESTGDAGLFTIKDSNIQGYGYGLKKGAGGWQSLNVTNSEIAATVYAYHLTGGFIDLLNIESSYFEGVCTSFIKVEPGASLKSLRLAGIWIYSKFITGTAFDIGTLNGLSVDGCFVFDQYTTFMNIAGSVLGYNGGALKVDGLAFTYSANPTSDVVYFTGTIPQFYSIDYPRSVAFCKLTASLNKGIEARSSYAGSSFLSAGHMLETATYNAGAVSGGSVDLASNGYPAYVIVFNTTSSTSVRLPPISANLPHGFTCTVSSSPSSTVSTTVTDHPDDGGATRGTVAAGGQRKFVFFRDGAITGWR